MNSQGQLSNQQVAFFCSQPFSLYLKSFLPEKLGRVFAIAQEGDFVMNLLSLAEVESVHVCGENAKSAMTVELKRSMLENSNWKNLEDSFHGPENLARLFRQGHWLPESFERINQAEIYLNYLTELEAYLKMKKQLSKITVTTGNVVKELSAYEPETFELIYLGQIFDQGNSRLDDWPKIISSRLTNNGQVIILSDQPTQFLSETFDRCGFDTFEPVKVTLPGNISTAAFLTLTPKH